MSTLAIPILMYHSLDDSGSVVSVTPDVFAGQMQRLAERGWRGITLKEAGEFHEAQGQWPKKSVVITFDDGFANVYSQGLPVLKPLGFSATVFLVTDHIDGCNDWAPPPPPLGHLPMLSWSQIDQLHEMGHELAPHTVTHPNLLTLSIDEVSRELQMSSDALTQRFGRTPKSFAYPFGHYDQVIEQATKKLFPYVCTTILRRAQHEALYALPRVDMFYIRTLRMFDKLIDGSLDRYLSMRRWARGLRSSLTSSC